MLPVNDTYGAWPRSGEIDIMEARGNSVEYKAQYGSSTYVVQERILIHILQSSRGIDYVRGSLNWGPFTWLNGVSKTFGWWTNRRKTFADGFHTYALEWSPEFIRIYVDSRLTYMLVLKFNEPFFERGDFPSVVANGSEYIQLQDPWAGGTRNVAPFDQPFYLIMNVAVGGTNGWFPDGVGNKPWLDGSITAMRDFAAKQDDWYATWPQNVEDRALVVDSTMFIAAPMRLARCFMNNQMRYVRAILNPHFRRSRKVSAERPSRALVHQSPAAGVAVVFNFFKSNLISSPSVLHRSSASYASSALAQGIWQTCSENSEYQPTRVQSVHN
ncbi:hypothetical protein NUW54_g2656 [Trametes sanguinea]|uniref:Uncharacterized protein n=1 Tax=Trametes sanguinea TaxID=158606 RepID=A0ACC1Q586_9APHY|nr:hypothetical protein NUW54_g2656 [Trametes sanguinea]